ncbi:LysM peptidoglycan-binding domain-containing protein [Mediterraneibacter sp.]|jgi:nucleoid-associated protein YgaU|uniref:LysM peptidoglycan-binding domain-containing protein n=1 Tax=Mediterraneibacter sp. TaxID=2316022 RepID=UPI0015B17F4D|nr:LysM peptidoglycan-binding domain-containing protein [Mediterraneibacter sp.]
MERQLPKNVRQIGNVSDSPKIYVEDYVDTFFARLCEKCEKAGTEPMGAFLVGDIQNGEEEDYVYIYGAIQMHDLKMTDKEYVIDEMTWKNAYEDCKQYFEDGEMLGWFVVHPGAPLVPEPETVKLHKKSFPKKNTVFIMKDPVEKEETYYVHKMNDLLEIGGHYTYYEKNPCMQNYMISSRKKNGASASETVEDRAAKDFRSLARKRGESQKGRRAGSLMYAAGACVVLILVIMGVSLFNSFDRMKSVQSTLGILGKETAQEQKDKPEEKQKDAETVAASAEVTEGHAVDQSSEKKVDETESPAEVKENPAAEEPEKTETSGTVSAGAGEGSEEQQVQETSGQVSENVNGQDGIYIVEKGDTLAIISRKMYGDLDHVDAICKMNGITDGNLIYIGQKLLLP